MRKALPLLAFFASSPAFAADPSPMLSIAPMVSPVAESPAISPVSSGPTHLPAAPNASAVVAPNLPQKHEAAVKEQKQETVVLGGNRFLIFSGSPGPIQYIYSVDLVKIDNGIPHFESLFMQDYEPETNTIALSDGVAFPSLSYHFDKATGMLNFTAKDPEVDVRYQYSYKLAGDMFELQEVMSQKYTPCPKEPCPAESPKSLYKVKDNAKTQ